MAVNESDAPLRMAAEELARRIEKVLPPGDELEVSSGGRYRMARVTWQVTSWYGSDDLSTGPSGEVATVLLRGADALRDPRFAGHGDTEARDIWLPDVPLTDVDSGLPVHIGGRAALLALAREREELIVKLGVLEIDDQDAIRRLRGEYPVV